MTWEQLSFWTDEELGLQGPKKIEKTVAIQLQELREQIAQDIENAVIKVAGNSAAAMQQAADIARGKK
jgi:hypothetical protein